MRIEATVYKRSIGFSKVYDFPLDEDVDEDLVDLCLTHVISRSDQIATFDFSSYYLVEASNDSQLGEYFIEEIGGVEELSKEQLESYFDYEAYGRDIRISGNAIDCDGVYLIGG